MDLITLSGTLLTIVTSFERVEMNQLHHKCWENHCISNKVSSVNSYSSDNEQIHIPYFCSPLSLGITTQLIRRCKLKFHLTCHPSKMNNNPMQVQLTWHLESMQQLQHQISECRKWISNFNLVNRAVN